MKTRAHQAFATCLALALFLTPSVASSQAMKTAAGDLLMTAPGGKRVVERPGGERVELPLATGAWVTDFRTIGQDWLVAAASRDSGGQKLELLQGRGAEVETLPSPALDGGAELMQPVFVADRQGFQALIWLEGDAHHQLAVKASRWMAGGWGATETLSAPGKGTQIALTTAILGDGSWLVAWAAFDGQDDEILWSRFEAGVWTKPQPIAANNAVPDITPQLFATDGGALIAWSRFDGNDYRVNVARFDGKGWSSPEVAGPAGSTQPVFSDAERPYLVYHQAVPSAWAVMELTADGAVRREATLKAKGPQRPVIAVTEQAVRFEWVGLDRKKVSAPVAWVSR